MDWKETDIYAEYINLRHRTDRNEKMIAELNRVGIKASRFEALKTDEHQWNEMKVQVMRNRTPGAIGCHYSQIQVMKNAFTVHKSAMVFEDDLIFCTDIQKRLDMIANFTNQNDWDVFWLGGTYHLDPTWHRSQSGIHLHPDMKRHCDCTLNKDWEPTNDKNIVRTFGCWSTYAYIVNYHSIEKILNLLDQHVHKSMGIDWLFIMLQPQLKTYAFNPGCVKQYNNKSDIGQGITNFEGFDRLGKHWFADKI